MKKKGQVQSLAPTMIALVLAGVLLIFGLIIIQETRDTDVITQAASGAVVNETLTNNVSDTAQNVEQAGYRGANGFSATQVDAQNASGDWNLDIGSGNYTFSSAGALTWSGDATYNNTPWNITYTYRHGDEAYASSNETIVGMGTFADFWEIIVLAIVITVVIGLLLAAFGGRRQR